MLFALLNKEVRLDIELLRAKDPAKANLSVLAIYLSSPGMQAVWAYRKQHRLYQRGHVFLALWLAQKTRKKTGVEIHPGAQLGRGVIIDHGAGVVIGETSIIGDECTLYQGVTLGGKKPHAEKNGEKRHPTLGSHVMVGAGAVILGDIVIGDHVHVGAGSVVTHSVEAGATVAGIPAHVIVSAPANAKGEEQR